MANKNMGRILSDAVIGFCVILLCTLSTSGQFKIQKLTFTISGSVGLRGVRMTGLPNSPITDESGYYSDTVEFNWSGKVTPVKTGYTFDPPYMAYNDVRSNLDNQNYTAEIMKFTISGTVVQAGVVMAGLPESPVSGSDGTYKAVVEYGWSGTVTPEKAGYTFIPPSKGYTQVNRHYTNENYTPAPIIFEITGSVGVGAVQMKGLPKPTPSDASGNYRGEVPYGWSGTITPEKAGYTFNPPSRPYSNVISAQTYQDYIAEAITFIISGTTGEAGVVMKGLPDNPITNSVGAYTAIVKYGFSSKVTPEKDGFTFKPPNMTYVDVKNDMGNQNYTAEEITYTISGLVGQEGVVMNGLLGNPVSGSGGTYKVTVPHGWSGAVTPTKDGFTFTPDNKIYPRVAANLSNENYTAAPITFTISGTAGVARVIMKGLPGRVITDENGSYSSTVIYGWSGTVMPERLGYAFDPSNRTYPRLISAEVNQDYIPTLQKRTVSGKILSAQGPIVGVIVSADGRGVSTTTNANGEYSLSVDYGWSGTVTPENEGYTFRPDNKRYPLVTIDQTNQDYTAEVVMLTISGTLAIGGVSLEGVLMSASEGGISDTTDAKGNYSVKVPYSWSGEIAPKKEGYSFDPPSETYANVTTDYKDGEPVLREPPAPRLPAPEPLTPRPAVPGPTAPRTVPPTMETRGPTLEVPSMPGLEEQFDQQKTLLERQIGSLQQQMDELLQELSGEVVGPGIPKVVGPNMPTVVGPEVSGAVSPRFPPVVSPRAPGVFRPQIPKVPGGPLVSGAYIDTDLREVLQDLAAQSGVKIYADETVKGTVTCRLISVPLERALQEVLKGTGLAFKEIPDSYLVYKPISNTFVDNELRDVLQTIAVDAGVVIIPDETIGGLITADLKAVPLETALEIVLAGTPYVVKKTPYYYLVASGGLGDPAFATVSETRRMKMNYIAADTAIALLSTAFRPYVQAEVTTQSVCITAPSSMADRIVSDLKQIDRPPRHVMLDARIVVMERSNLLNLGIEWGWPNISAGVFGSDFRGSGPADMRFGGKWPWGVQIGYTPDAIFTDSLMLTLNLLSQNGEADVVSSPQVLGQDGRQAELRVINEEYFFLVAPTVAGYYREAQLETIEAGTVLTITPRVGDNNDITLEIAAEVSDVVSRGAETEETLPLVTVARRTATNTVRIKDGGTVALAGLTENRRILDVKKTPGLSSIPILGNLFNNKRDQTTTREVAIFITARLVPEMEELVEVAEPSGELIPTEPVGEGEFQMRLRESLSRLR
ncbi:MAG: hypothetical protein ACETVZ_06905 [Phycisphaerae bacterium]